MLNSKTIWRDNTMPPTNYIWMRTNMKNQLIGVYEWLNGRWRRIKISDGGCDTYSRSEIDYLLEYTEQEIIRKINDGEYQITGITIDDEIDATSSNPVENRVIAEALSDKVDQATLDALKDDIPHLAGIEYGTTDYWNNKTGYIPKEGELIIYSDYSTIVKEGQTINIPRIKIGSGNSYVQDLAFLDEDLSSALYSHILDTAIHVSAGDKDRWNNKLNVDDNYEVSEETLIFNRN